MLTIKFTCGYITRLKDWFNVAVKKVKLMTKLKMLRVWNTYNKPLK